MQRASRKAGASRGSGSTGALTSGSSDRGTERRAEIAVFERLFLPRMHHYRVLAKENPWSSVPGVLPLGPFLAYLTIGFEDTRKCHHAFQFPKVCTVHNG
jgi:hypothetical protein